MESKDKFMHLLLVGCLIIPLIIYAAIQLGIRNLFISVITLWILSIPLFKLNIAYMFPLVISILVFYKEDVDQFKETYLDFIPLNDFFIYGVLPFSMILYLKIHLNRSDKASVDVTKLNVLLFFGSLSLSLFNLNYQSEIMSKEISKLIFMYILSLHGFVYGVFMFSGLFFPKKNSATNLNYYYVLDYTFFVCIFMCIEFVYLLIYTIDFFLTTKNFNCAKSSFNCNHTIVNMCFIYSIVLVMFVARCMKYFFV